jgi:hypothetical protein
VTGDGCVPWVCNLLVRSLHGCRVPCCWRWCCCESQPPATWVNQTHKNARGLRSRPRTVHIAICLYMCTLCLCIPDQQHQLVVVVRSGWPSVHLRPLFAAQRAALALRCKLWWRPLLVSALQLAAGIARACRAPPRSCSALTSEMKL